MNLAEKLKHLREVEGELRGLGRAMTQVEVVDAMEKEQQGKISQAYLSQLEGGKRLHLTASTRDLLARFFKVHPGYLVNDPPDYSIDLLTAMDMESDTDRLTTRLVASAAEWRSEPDLQELLQNLADVEDPRRFVKLFCMLIALPIEELETLFHAAIQQPAPNTE
jgi:transcriptional regulator with XRE-family HTH domain